MCEASAGKHACLQGVFPAGVGSHPSPRVGWDAVGSLTLGESCPPRSRIEGKLRSIYVFTTCFGFRLDGFCTPVCWVVMPLICP